MGSVHSASLKFYAQVHCARHLPGTVNLPTQASYTAVLSKLLTVWLCSVLLFTCPIPVNAKHEIAPGNRFMVSAAHPLAVDAGLEILDRGGTAVDAAVAIQMVLNLVEPQSSGIGGGAFMLVFDQSSGEVMTYDGRETAPMSVTPELFLDDQGEPRKFFDAVVGGLSVGAPGTVALLARAHADHGKRPWSELFQNAVSLAEEGFAVSPRLASALSSSYANSLQTFPAARHYFFPNGKPLQVGEIITNPALGRTLAAIARNGADEFYRGDIAKAIIHTVQNAENREGHLDLADLAAYQAVNRPPICHPYRSYRVCGMGPPSSGAIAVGQILGILENFDLSTLGADSPLSWHLIAEASKLAFADRNQYAADADFVDVPVAGLLNSDYLRSRANRIQMDAAASAPVQYGTPPGYMGAMRHSDSALERSGTSHFSIVDEQGNAVSMTTTIEGPFGSQLMVNGFMLNNELTDFSFVPQVDGKAVANRVQPGKRPRSSMSPTMVFNSDGALRLVVGSPGGSRIIGYVVKTLIAVLDWNLHIQAVIELGNVVNRNGATELEKATQAEWALQSELSRLGHELQIRSLVSGLYGIEIVDGILRGGADPRRDGMALAQ